VNVNPTLNALYYELGGTYSTNQGRLYRDANRQRTITSQAIQAAFGVLGFVNSAAAPERPKTFLVGFKDKQHTEVPVMVQGNPVDVEILVAPVPWPKRLAAQAPLAGKISGSAPADKQFANPWRYVSTRPTNNAASFDLWAEVVIGKQRKTIGNWNE
jgi:hypothetical protein